MLVWNTLFWMWISSITLQKWKNALQKKILIDLVTKLEKILVFGKTLCKISSNWWFQESCWPISLWLEHLKPVIYTIATVLYCTVYSVHICNHCRGGAEIGSLVGLIFAVQFSLHCTAHWIMNWLSNCAGFCAFV